MAKYKVGDRVICKTSVGSKYIPNARGTIVCSDDSSYCVKFDYNVGGHNGKWRDYVGEDGYHWWVAGDNLVVDEPKPEPTPIPTPIEVNITVNLYENACWYCRKGGLVDLYLAGAMGICPNCKRVCNATNSLPKAHKPSNPWKKQNTPLTTEELKALPDGTRVFTVGLNDSGLTTWRVKKDKLLYREHKHTHVSITTNGESYNAYLEEPERPKEPEEIELDW